MRVGLMGLDLQRGGGETLSGWDEGGWRAYGLALCAAVVLACAAAVAHASAPVALAVAALGAAIVLLGERGRRMRRRASATAAYLREREVHFQSILDTAPDGMVVFDARGVIRAFSAAAERQFGWTAAEVIGSDLGRLLPDAGQVALDGDLGPRPSGGARRDGSTFALELSLAESGFGKRRLFTAFVRDLSKREVSAQPLRDAERDAITQRLTHLSARERQVLDELVAGQANKAIAFALSISPRTVEIYRAKLMAKMKAKSLPELVRMALVADA